MIASELMTTELCIVDGETTLAEASALMGRRHIGSALVLEGDTLAGIVTERDIVRAFSNTHDAPARPVAEWMTPHPVTGSPGMDVREVLRLMIDGGFRHLPITEDERPVGMLSMRDVARVLST